MERIQAALSKAREARQIATGAEPPAGETSPRSGASSRSPEVRAEDKTWAALETWQPSQRTLERGRITAVNGGTEAAAFDVLRTRIRKQMAEKDWRRLAVTSPGAACGKSTLCVNLGYSLARQSDTRVIVVETDLRRPSIARILDLKHRQQFSEVLAGRATLAEHMVRVSDNLAFATNYAPVRNSAELLHAPLAAEVLDRLDKIYQPDIVIFDLPPMLVSDDAIAFLGHVDCALLVAAAGTSTIEQLDTCERELATHTNVLGIALNKCRYMPRRGYGYGYGY